MGHPTSGCVSSMLASGAGLLSRMMPGTSRFASRMTTPRTHPCTNATAPPLGESIGVSVANKA